MAVLMSKINVPDEPAPGTVHLTLRVHPDGDMDRALKIHGERVAVTLVVAKCSRCCALLLPDDIREHALWHGQHVAMHAMAGG